MKSAPHPADYMTDAAYEQFVADGGINDVTLNVDILNYGLDVQQELLVENFSGFFDDFSEEAQDALLSSGYTPAEVDNHDAGEWLVVADGEVDSFSEFCPYRTHVKLHRAPFDN